MVKHQQEREGFKMRIDGRILYGVIVALIGFVIRAESHHSSVNTRLEQLEQRTGYLRVGFKNN